MKQNHLDWFRNAKLGLFIHFGLYSLLGGCWQGKPTPGLAEWIQNDLNIPAEEYAQLAARFDPHRFDAREIAALAREWGMTLIGYARGSRFNVYSHPERFSDLA
mgnify:CR=1 FL=1